MTWRKVMSLSNCRLSQPDNRRAHMFFAPKLSQLPNAVSKFSAPTIAFLAFWLAKKLRLYNNYSMSPSWIWSDKITNESVARDGYNHFISNKGKRNNCFSKFSNRVLPPIFISTILQSVRKEHITSGHMRSDSRHHLITKSWMKVTATQTTICEESVNLAHYFPYDVKLRLLAHSRSFFSQSKS